MILGAYRVLTQIGAPLISLYLNKRKKKGKEDPERFNERLGIASTERVEGCLIWMHGASVGEAMSILPLAEKMLAMDGGLHILLTTGSVTSAKLVSDKKTNSRLIHQFIPVDRIPYVRNFLDHWKPDLAIWFESDLWPNMVMEASSRNIPMALVNARMSDRSFIKWQKYPAMIGKLLSRFQLTLAQSAQDLERLTKLGSRNVVCLGNIKFAAPALEHDPQALEELKIQIGFRPLWMAASTHPGEEEECIKVHKELKKNFPELLTIIVPRHPHRGNEIVAQHNIENIAISQRSKSQKISPETDIYLADTLGEMGLFYSLSPIVFMGKSMTPLGGQNLLEPARLDCAVLCGPYMTNFAEIMKAFEKDNAVLTVQSYEELGQSIQWLLHNPKEISLSSKRALQVVGAQNEILDHVSRRLFDFLKESERPVS